MVKKEKLRIETEIAALVSQTKTYLSEALEGVSPQTPNVIDAIHRAQIACIKAHALREALEELENQ